MNYEDFIGCLRKAQTQHVKALSFPQSCAVTQIPDTFSVLLADIVTFIQNNITEFCDKNQIVALFGLQAAAGGIQSKLPQQLNRIRYNHYPNCHFSCTLSYLVLPRNQIDLPTDWQGFRTLVIDFTTGKIMDSDRYIFLALGDGQQGKVYGALNQNLLAQAWQYTAAN